MRTLLRPFAAAFAVAALASCGPAAGIQFDVTVPADTPQGATVLATSTEPAFGSGVRLTRGGDGHYHGFVAVKDGTPVHFELRLQNPDATEADFAYQPVAGHDATVAVKAPNVVVTVVRWEYAFDPARPAVTVTVHLPAGSPDVPMFLAGNFPGVQPSIPKGFRMGKRADGSYIAKLYAAPGTSGLLLVDQGTWTAAGYDAANHDWAWIPVTAGAAAQTVDVTVPGWLPSSGQVLTGDIRYLRGVASSFLLNTRDVVIWLPPNYAAEPSRSFPVLYMHDGQNLMDATTSFAGEWHADETAQRLVKLGLAEPVIIVGVYNTGNSRIDEYTEVTDPCCAGQGGKADLYGRFLAEELKPQIDAAYRTLPDPAHTGLAGSSLGGLVSMYFGLTRTEFQKLGVVSPSVWWGNKDIVTRVNAIPQKLPLRIWEDIGTNEGSSSTSETVADARALRDALVAKGWAVGQDLGYLEVSGAGHNEAAWSARFDQILAFLYPPQ